MSFLSTLHYDLEDIQRSGPGHIARASWTAVIHAVGPQAANASALPLLAWCAERLEPFCHHRLLVVPQGSAVLTRPALDEAVSGPFKLITQREPLGVGNALQLCQAAVKTPHVVVMELGSTALKDGATRACMALAKQSPEAPLIRPIVEGKDCGTFFFKSGSLFRGLTAAGASILRGFKGESLSTVIPHLETYPGAMITVRMKRIDLEIA